MPNMAKVAIATKVNDWMIETNAEMQRRPGMVMIDPCKFQKSSCNYATLDFFILLTLLPYPLSLLVQEVWSFSNIMAFYCLSMTT
ncbi:hypothetical protein ACE1AT_26030 [Pelatocladus sp. BLCC-F211]|uniref:hypothetical protein n=1 Tax=Pelatocladus sp. BLCC-F211 TaxID=3342752 RepID=UPI0035B6DA6F